MFVVDNNKQDMYNNKCKEEHAKKNLYNKPTFTQNLLFLSFIFVNNKRFARRAR